LAAERIVRREQVVRPPDTRCAKCESQQDRTQTLADDHAVDLTRLCAEGEADAQLPCPQSGHVCDDAVDADGDEKHADAGEE
jgi:hypothetical protein